MEVDPNEFQYVTEVVPPPPPPPPPTVVQSLPMGLLDGALAGIAFLGWETAVTGWLGLQPAVGVQPVAVVLLYVVTGALFGGVSSSLGLTSGRWLLLSVLFAAGWLASGYTATVTDTLNQLLSIPALAALALLLGYYGAARDRDHSAAGSIAIALFLCIAVLVPVDLWHIRQPISVYGIGVNAAVVLVAGLAGGLCGMLIEDEVPNRHILLGGVAVAWLASVPVLRPFAGAWPRGDGDGPPIVVVTVGGLRADHLGVYGYERATSPHIDELASTRALVYADATTTAPWSVPAIGSLFTGRLPSHHDAGTFGDPRNFPLDETSPYLPELLEKKGYATAAIVTHPLLRRPYGFSRGFDYYDDRVGYGVPPTAFLPLDALGLNLIGWRPYRSAEHVGSRARSFVEAQSGGGWMLWVYFSDLLEPSRAASEELTVLGADERGPVGDYDAALRRVDAEVGALIDALPEGAWVVVTADRGTELNERRQVEGRPDDARAGHSLFQELVHVPLLLLGPDVQPSWVREPVSTVDVAPTLAHLAGLEPEGMTGVPLRGTPGAPREGSVVVSEFVRYGEERKAVRRGEFKLVYTESGGPRLFNLTLDPYERSPIRQLDREQQTLVKELQAELPHFRKPPE